MPGRNKPLITRNGIPDPQAYNPQTGQWESFIGVSWGKTAGGLYVPIRVDDQGRQEVTLSGANVQIASGTNFEVAPGSASPTQAGTYDYKNFTWLYVRVLAQSEHNFDVEQEIMGYTRLKLAGKSLASIIFLSDPFRPLGINGRIWIRNTSLDPQKYSFQIFGMTG